MPRTDRWRQLGNTVAVIFVIAVLGNYPWELAQASLYVGMENFRIVWWHCFVASLGDGLLVLGIFAAGWFFLRQHTWFVHPGARGYGVMVMTGLMLGVAIEWIAVHLLGRWMYTASMPLVPGLAVGIVPVVQMLVLPPLIFRGAAAWHHRTALPGGNLSEGGRATWKDKERR
jgi:hypothetical protein